MTAGGMVIDEFLSDKAFAVRAARLHGTLNEAIGDFQRTDFAGGEKMLESHELLRRGSWAETPRPRGYGGRGTGVGAEVFLSRSVLWA